jgi:hypothetical protein
MALKLVYYGQNDSQFSADVTLVGDPGVDQQTLTAAGYLGGRIMALAVPGTNTAVQAVLIPADVDGQNVSGFTAGAGTVPYAALINGPGEFAGAIGPSGSKKVPVVRALFQGNVNSESYDSYNSPSWAIGTYLYAGGHTTHNAGMYTTLAYSGGSPTTANRTPVGITTHVPTTSEPWLGVASLL